jgi:hypothetical protein
MNYSRATGTPGGGYKEIEMTHYVPCHPERRRGISQMREGYTTNERSFAFAQDDPGLFVARPNELPANH